MVDLITTGTKADPRYLPGAVKHDLASMGIFKGVVSQTVDVGDGCVDDADFKAEYLYGIDRQTRVEWVDLREVYAIQPYWCEGNIERLQQLPPSKREMPIVFEFDGDLFLMDGTHRCLLHLIEGGTMLIEVRYCTTRSA